MAFDPISAIFDVGGKLIDKLIPDPQAKAPIPYACSYPRPEWTRTCS